MSKATSPIAYSAHKLSNQQAMEYVRAHPEKVHTIDGVTVVADSGEDAEILARATLIGRAVKSGGFDTRNVL